VISEIKNVGKIQRWIVASRPKTLPAAFAPVFVGSALAININSFKLLNAFVALTCSILIQIGTNFVNDLFDFLSGKDSLKRVGPTRAVASGMVSPIEMKYAILITFGITFLLGLFLVYESDYWILMIGILSILAGIAYTAGPFPLAYNALGDIFVFIFFGLVGTIGTFYVQSIEITQLSVLASIPVGALITNILIVNNLRDIDEDKANRKITLAVLLGKSFTKFQYLFQLGVSYAVVIYIYFNLINHLFVLLPLVSLPIGVALIKMIFAYKGTALNKTLAITAMFSALFSLLLAVGIALS